MPHLRIRTLLAVLCLATTAACAAGGSDSSGVGVSAAASVPVSPSATAATSTSASAPTSAPASGSVPSSGSAPSSSAAGRQMTLPSAGADFDYQIGGAYAAPAGVRVVSRDRGDKPSSGLYNVCYVNAFQAQPDAALDWWRSHAPDLLLSDGSGHIVMDTNWNEALLDTSTAAKRSRLAAIVGGWIDGCAAAGFQAVEADNLDSFSRSQSLLTQDDNAAFARLLAVRAHADGLAFGQKNTAELLSKKAAIGFDFAVTEECGAYDECAEFASAYAGRVLDVEYSDSGLAAACAAWRGRISIVRRDVGVVPSGSDGYVRRTCTSS